MKIKEFLITLTDEEEDSFELIGEDMLNSDIDQYPIEYSSQILSQAHKSVIYNGEKCDILDYGDKTKFIEKEITIPFKGKSLKVQVGDVKFLASDIIAWQEKRATEMKIMEIKFKMKKKPVRPELKMINREFELYEGVTLREVLDNTPECAELVTTYGRGEWFCWKEPEPSKCFERRLKRFDRKMEEYLEWENQNKPQIDNFLSSLETKKRRSNP